MGWLDLFRKRKAPGGKTPQDQDSGENPVPAASDLRAEVLRLDAQIGTIHIALSRHEDALAECRTLTGQQGKALTRLEALVDNLPARSPLYRDRSVRADPATSIPPSVIPAASAPIPRLDIDRFSEQEKRILAVFFQNRDRQMSYADVAAVLDKSACTVKNQMNQIRQKADLFDCAIGRQSRNVFKLKDDLKVEKYLRMGRPMERPLPITRSDQSTPEPAPAPTECAFSNP